MKEERLMILEMVKEGKISADEAAKLLKTVSNEASNEEKVLEDKFEAFYSNVDSFAKDLKRRAENAYHKAEPKIKVATKKTLEKTVDLMQDVSEKLKGTVNKLEDELEEMVENTSEKVEEVIENVTDEVEEMINDLKKDL